MVCIVMIFCFHELIKFYVLFWLIFQFVGTNLVCVKKKCSFLCLGSNVNTDINGNDGHNGNTGGNGGLVILM